MSNQPSDPQTAKSKESASLADKVEALNEFTTKCQFAMLTTRIASTGQLNSRCMAIGAKESKGLDLLFFTNAESGKTSDLQTDSSCNVAFLDSTGQWASFAGNAKVDQDRSVIHKHYSPSLKAWLGDLGDGKHDGGPDDPRIGAIRVTARTITYSYFNRGVVGRAVEIARGTVTGETPGFTSIRELNEAEVEEWRSVSNN